jgi:hypothetical protein
LSEVERTLRFCDLNSPGRKEAEKAWWQKIRKGGIKKPQQAVLLSILNENLQEWMALVPEDKIDDFVTELMHCGQSYTEKYLDQPRAKVGLRTRALIWGEMRDEINKRLLTKPAKVMDAGSKSVLDTLPPLSHTAGVQNEIRDLKGLIERLKKVTAPRGAKAALAREFKVTRQAVNQWLSGESNPSADLAIRLQYWKPKLPAK